MAPEQASGESGGVGPATDVYSLGAVFYEMLTGRPPFSGDTVEQIIRRIRNEGPRPMGPRVPKELRSICLKCLAKEYDRRFASAAELADQLQSYLDANPVGDGV